MPQGHGNSGHRAVDSGEAPVLGPSHWDRGHGAGAPWRLSARHLRMEGAMKGQHMMDGRWPPSQTT